jgi:hypothetical protein
MPDDEKQGLSPAESPDSPDVREPSGFRPSELELIRQAESAAVDAGRSIAVSLLEIKGRDRLKIVRVFRSQIIPPGRPGRRRKERITAAHRDWKNGIRGVALYRKHIEGWDKHGQWRRKGEERRLMDAIRSRERRDQGKKPSGELPRLPDE